MSPWRQEQKVKITPEKYSAPIMHKILSLSLSLSSQEDSQYDFKSRYILLLQLEAKTFSQEHLLQVLSSPAPYQALI